MKVEKSRCGGRESELMGHDACQGGRGKKNHDEGRGDHGEELEGHGGGERGLGVKDVNRGENMKNALV